MKKRLLSISLLTIFLIVGFNFLNKSFASQHIFVNVYEDYLSLSEKTNIDILFYGSSHAYTAFNPLIIDDKCKTVSYNIGSASLNISLAELVLNETLKHSNPKLVILEIFEGSTEEVTSKKNKGFQLRALDIIPNYSFDKLLAVKNIYTKDEYLGVLFPLIRNHDKWGDSTFIGKSKRQALNKNTLFFHSGYRGHFKKLEISDRKLFEDSKKADEPQKKNEDYINSDTKKAIKKFVKTAKSNGIDVLIVTSPDLNSIGKDKIFFQELNELCASLNTPYINLNDYFEKIGLTLDDFMDLEHLNIYGGYKTSQFLADYLNSNYHFIDRSNEPLYKENSNVFNLSEDLFIKAEESFSTHLDKKLIEGMLIQNLKIERNNRDYTISLNFENDKGLKENFKKYNISFKIYPFDEKNLSEQSIKKGENFDKIDIKLAQQNSQVKLYLNSKIKQIKQVEFFIYNSEKYKGVVGQKIIMDDINLQ
ncbi:MAG: hypothetical protein Q8O62_06775 [Aequorivita sp.]|nr:hypothetical protein [Aequorivita sp.]